MRINKRFVQKAPKRGTDELKIELSRLKVLKFWKTMNSALNECAIKLRILLAAPFKALTEAITQLCKTVNDYFEKHPEVREKLQIIQEEQKLTGRKNPFQEMPIFNIDSLLHTLETS
jgi:hypothetical protein